MARSSCPLLPYTYFPSAFPPRQPRFHVMYNMPTINYVQPQHLVMPDFPHTIVTFIIPVILNLMELKCQCKGDSPFETNPITMWIGLSCLLAYCLAYGVELRFFPRLRSPDCSSHLQMIRRGSTLLGCLCSASLASILLPSMMPLFYGFSGLLSIGDIVQCCKILWKWVDERIVSKFFKPYQEQQEERYTLPV